MKKIFLILAIGAFALTSCKKNNDKKSCTLTEANLVGSYKVVSVKYKASASASEMDYTDQYLETCEKDDITTFNANHTYAYTDAGTTCTPAGDATGDWSLSGNTVTSDGDTATLENFSCSGFTVSGTDVITTGDKLSINYAKQ